MPRKRKTEVKVNDYDSLTSLMQETYNDACLNISDAQKAINELSSSIIGQDATIEDLVKVAKEKGGLLKVKDSAIRLKLELAKLQNDIIKANGDAEAAISERSNGTVSSDDFKAIRDMIKNKSNGSETFE